MIQFPRRSGSAMLAGCDVNLESYLLGISIWVSLFFLFRTAFLPPFFPSTERLVLFPLSQLLIVSFLCIFNLSLGSSNVYIYMCHLFLLGDAAETEVEMIDTD